MGQSTVPAVNTLLLCSAQVILDGTPRWEVLQSVPVASAFGIANQSAASAAPPPPATSSGTAGGGVAAAFSRLGGSGRRFKPVETRSGASGASIVFGDDENNPQVLDLQFDGGNDPSAIVERTESGIAIVRLNQGDGEAAAGRSRVGNWGSEAGTGVASGRDGTEGTRGPKGGSDGGDGEGSGLGGRGRSRFRGSPGSGPDVFSEVLRDAGLSEQEPAVSLEVSRASEEPRLLLSHLPGPFSRRFVSRRFSRFRRGPPRLALLLALGELGQM